MHHALSTWSIRFGWISANNDCANKRQLILLPNHYLGDRHQKLVWLLGIRSLVWVGVLEFQAQTESLVDYWVDFWWLWNCVNCNHGESVMKCGGFVLLCLKSTLQFWIADHSYRGLETGRWTLENCSRLNVLLFTWWICSPLGYLL